MNANTHYQIISIFVKKICLTFKHYEIKYFLLVSTINVSKCIMMYSFNAIRHSNCPNHEIYNP